ncbi:DUF4431 domain-containing protein [Methyloligella solikamskensis]|uniref:DUF4431 domain-containing protein n=1 Tax=Methyloligella solikamskensis TaxID=1177756 RepID=A0ABW3JBS2_9HYPH
MRLPFALTVAAVCLFASPAFADRCLKAGDDETLIGVISAGEFEDAAGRPESALILNLEAPECLTGDDENDQIDTAMTVHIFGADDQMHEQLQGAVGKEVLVLGTPFGAMTVHHHAPIVMEVTAVQTP